MSWGSFLPLLEQMQRGLNLQGVILALSKIWVLSVEGRLAMISSHQVVIVLVIVAIPGGRIFGAGNLNAHALILDLLTCEGPRPTQALNILFCCLTLSALKMSFFGNMYHCYNVLFLPSLNFNFVVDL